MTLLQQRDSGNLWRSLRPFRINDTLHCMVGTPHDWQLHEADVLIPHILSHEFDFDHPLPDPLPVPPAFTSLPPSCRAYVVRYALGEAVAETLKELEVSEADALVMGQLIRDAGITLLSIRDSSPAVAQHALSRKEQLLSSAPPDDLTPAAPEPITLTPLPAAPSPLPTPFGDVVPIPAPLVEKIRRDAERGPDRIRWPFPDMAPLTQITIRREYADRAQRAAHVYAHRHGWKMRTYRDPRTGTLTIMRLGTPEPFEPSPVLTPETDKGG
jgi:hypothetical protein